MNKQLYFKVRTDLFDSVHEFIHEMNVLLESIDLFNSISHAGKNANFVTLAKIIQSQNF